MKIAAVCFSVLLALSTTQGATAVGFDFLNLPVSARTAGGTVSLIGERDNNLSVRTNPAMLAGISRPAFSIDFSPVIMDIYRGAFSVAFLLENGFVLAPSVSYVNFGTLDPVDENGDPINAYISPFSLSVETALARNFYERLSIGARLKFIHEQISQEMAGHWGGYFSGGFAIDAGIFAQRNFFRYSAGFRNIGFAYDNYESDVDLRMPASSFVGVGIIIENEAKLYWFFEAENFFHAYGDGHSPLFFRTGFEFPVHRDILILRTGTAFTPDDVRHVFNTFRGQTVKAWEYSSQNWLLASVGATINARIARNLLSLDIACQFRKDGLKPSFLFSGTMYF
ncbi:MAG: hypothetical protein FWE23_07345 [Chitinivibrionia bacterium]|nr:hypothetical protein [Chitinivibrionia bacterium]